MGDPEPPECQPVAPVSAPQPRRWANQHKPLPPRLESDHWIVYYWHLGFPDAKIADHTLDHFDRKVFGLSAKSVQRIRGQLDLKGTIKQAATFETLKDIYQVLRARFPTMGARKMVFVIRQDYSIKVSEKLVNDFLRYIEPAAVEARKREQFKRRWFWSAGVMEIWSIDQHDKWGRFGLWWHLGIDPFTGRLAWLRVWWCNRNPRLLIGYYIAAGRVIGGIPLITMSNCGRENNGIANMHTVIRHRLDPTLATSLQHRFCINKNNIKSEAAWAQFRKQWVPGFEDALDFGVNNGLYNPADPLENLVFRWLAIPWLQTEVDQWVRLYNSTTRRANKNKVLPHGIPDIIHAKPERFNAKNFQILVPPVLFDEMQHEWAPLDDPVFQCTPPTFHIQAEIHYTSIGSPAVSKGTFWDIYASLLASFRDTPEDPTLWVAFRLANLGADEEMELMPGFQELRNGDKIVGDAAFIQGDYAAEFDDSDDDLADYAKFSSDDEQ
ncbi:hypothetical protein JOM56_015058 [Amanita muscaria]